MRDIKQSLTQAQKSGERFDEWRENIEPTLQKRGWLGKTIVTNPVTGENKEIHIGSGRLKTIFTTNMQVAYQVARYDAMRKLDTAVYWRYVSAKLETTRASHAKLHGTILHRDDPFWQKNYPPNGFNCYCTVTAYSKEEVEARGWKIADSTPPTIADKDWNYDVGATARARKLDQVLEQKAKRYGLTDAEIAKIRHEIKVGTWQRSFDEMVDEVSSGEIIKEKKRQVAQVGELKLNTIKALAKIGKKPEYASIAIYQRAVKHMLRDTKPELKEPVVAEIKQTIKVLDEAKHCYFDWDNDNIIYFYPSLRGDGMVNCLILRTDHILKKFRTDNFVITINRVKDIDFRSMIKDKERYKRLR